MRALYLSALAALGIDQMSKVIVVHLMDLKTVLSIPVAPPYLVFRMGWNEGINFGLLSGAGARWLLIAVCLLYTSPSPRDRQKSRMPSSA